MFKPNPAKVQLMAQRFLIHGFQESRPQNPMNLDGRPKHPFRNLILMHWFFSALLCVLSASALKFMASL
jgi:hypothetical protein